MMHPKRVWTIADRRRLGQQLARKRITSPQFSEFLAPISRNVRRSNFATTLKSMQPKRLRDSESMCGKG